MIEALALVCSTIQVEAGQPGPSEVLAVKLPSGERASLGALDERINAIGYSAPQDKVYGVGADGRVVVLDSSGKRLDVVSHPSVLLRHGTAGAVVGERLLVRVGHLLLAVDVDPASGRYLEIVDKTALWSHGESIAVDDFDVNPADGLLYGVATSGHGHAHVVSIDPGSGRVRRVADAGRLPGGSTYGAAVFGRDGALYATNNDVDGRSVLYRVALDGSGGVAEVSVGARLHTSDAAGCLSVPPVPPDPTTPPTPDPPTSEPPTPRPPTSEPPAPEPPTSEPPTSEPPTSEPPAPPTSDQPPTRDPPPPDDPRLPAVPPVPGRIPPPGVPPAAPPQPAPTPEPTRDSTQDPTRPSTRMRLPEARAKAVASRHRTVRDQRRWSLVAIILILAAGAMARMHARRR
ncbi:DUF6923 family protein [Saccharothrix obliqua]|uniref:DUF6923 family protein n=1 Tax=Saccharothrix obliqua TaxID=2861747 RepID=UPI001C5CCB72|nr:hypothetical protein [Saccharothrix obliqua]MBW4717059.1 hypothetical protein [Saccharothrix obliqua]